MKPFTVLLISLLALCEIKAQLSNDKITLAFDVEEMDDNSKLKKYRIYDSGKCIIFTYYKENGNLNRPFLIDTIYFSDSTKYSVTYRWYSYKYLKSDFRVFNPSIEVAEFKSWDYDRNGNLEAWYIGKNEFDSIGRISKSQYDSLSYYESAKHVETYSYYEDSVVILNENNLKTIEYLDSSHFYVMHSKKVNFNKFKSIQTSCLYYKNGNLRSLWANTDLGYSSAGRKQNTYYYSHSNYILCDENGFIISKKTIEDEIPDQHTIDNWKVTILHSELGKTNEQLIQYLSSEINAKWALSYFPKRSLFPLHFNGLRKNGDIISSQLINDDVDTTALHLFDLNSSNIHYPNGTYMAFRKRDVVLIDRNENHLSSFRGCIPIVKKSMENKDDFQTISKYIIMSRGSSTVSNSQTKINKDDPLISKPDFENPSTWKDSVNKKGERVYGLIRQYYFELKNGKFGLSDAFGNLLIDTVYNDIMILQVTPLELLKNMANYSELIKINGRNLTELNENIIFGYVGVSKEGHKLFDKSGKLLFDQFFDKISVTKKDDTYLLTLTSGKTRIILDQFLQIKP